MSLPFRILTQAGLSLALALQPACILGIGRCNYELRYLDLKTVLRDSRPGLTEVPTAVVTLSESRGQTATDSRVLGVAITSSVSRQIASVTLLRVASGDTTVQASWTNGSYQPPPLWYANIDLASASPSRPRLVWLANEGELWLIADIVQVGGEPRTLSGMLRVSANGDWERPSCD